jgi:hypothetical protein
MRSNYGKSLRLFLGDGVQMKQIIDFGELPVFPEAATFPAIFITEKSISKKSIIYARVNSLNFISLEKIVSSIGINLQSNVFNNENWNLSEDFESSLMHKMDRLGISLREYVHGKIFSGIKTGLNEAFIIDQEIRAKLISEDPRSTELIKPLIVGDDIRKFQINFSNRYLIYVPWHFPLNTDNTIKGASKTAEDSFKDQYPGIYNHLFGFKDALLKRNAAETGIRYEWYALQRFASDYYHYLEVPKIVYPVIAKESRFAADFEGRYFLNDKCFFT